MLCGLPRGLGELPPDGLGEALGGADPQRVRAELIAEHGIVTTFADVRRAPFELTAPVLRISPHVDVTAAELDQVADALARYR